MSKNKGLSFTKLLFISSSLAFPLFAGSSQSTNALEEPSYLANYTPRKAPPPPPPSDSVMRPNVNKTSPPPPPPAPAKKKTPGPSSKSPGPSGGGGLAPGAPIPASKDKKKKAPAPLTPKEKQAQAAKDLARQEQLDGPGDDSVAERKDERAIGGEHAVEAESHESGGHRE